ncbi:FAD dependent oxidoreductase-domain-containing protein [Peziza echinospora]|nr:FAD dependent oxidoreductase-domain-containing protein [Peziza echinospora]
MSLDPDAVNHARSTPINRVSDALMNRIRQDPGRPRPNPMESYWQKTSTPICSIQHPIDVPMEADIVIIGSGISAVAVARTLLSTKVTRGKDGLRIVVLDARKLCSGATGRNGGHIKASTYIEYQSLKRRFGVERALDIIEFRKRHLNEMLKVAEEEGITLQCEMREVEGVDVFFDKETWEKHKEYVHEYVIDRGEDDDWAYRIWEAEDIQTEFRLDHAIGCIGYPAGTISPYTFTTRLWEKLIHKHPWLEPDFYPHHHKLSIQTNTECRSIDQLSRNNLVVTPRGTIEAKHVIHCTNAHAAHLFPQLIGKIFPLRGQMTAQYPPDDFPDSYTIQAALRVHLGEHADYKPRSWVFIYKKGFDYLMLRPPPLEGDPPQISTSGVLMFGGGLSLGDDDGFGEFGLVDDGERQMYGTGGPNIRIAAYLGGMLQYLFRKGESGNNETLVGGNSGRGNVSSRVISNWTGIMGFSADELPWVGRVEQRIPPGLARLPPLDTTPFKPSGQWISAGFSGEGMVNAWGCGVKVATMVLDEINGAGRTEYVKNVHFPDDGKGLDVDSVDEWFPEEYLITDERIDSVNMEYILNYYQN